MPSFLCLTSSRDLGDEAVRQTATIDGQTLAGRAGYAAATTLMALQHCQEDDVGLLGGQRGVDAISKGFHGPADRCGPYAIDGSVVAANTLQLELNLAREPRTVERMSRGGRVCYPRPRVSDIQYFGRNNRGGRGRWQGSRCRGSILGWGLCRRSWRRDARVWRDLRRRGARIFAGPEGIGSDGDAGEGQDSAAQLSHLTRPPEADRRCVTEGTTRGSRN
jgi:hypothetical protein